MEKYDSDYRDQRKKRLQGHDGKCAVTRTGGYIETHHNLPKGLGGPNVEGNLLPLANHFHSYLHRLVNVVSPEQFAIRTTASKALWKDPLHEDSSLRIEAIKSVDSKVMPQYVTNLLTKFHGDIQSAVTIQTVVHNMTALRDMTIENITLKAENARLLKIIDDLNSEKSS